MAPLKVFDAATRKYPSNVAVINDRAYASLAQRSVEAARALLSSLPKSVASYPELMSAF